MTRISRTAAAAVAWWLTLVLVTVTACSPGPPPAPPTPSPEPTHQGNTAPVDADTETVLEVPDGPTVAIPEGAASGPGQLSVATEDDEAMAEHDGVSGWEIHIDDAELNGQATITFPMQLQPDEPLPLVGYRDDATGEYVPVEVELVDGHPTVRTEHFSWWFTQDMREARDTLAGFVRGAALPFPNAEAPQCSGAEDVKDTVSVQASDEELMWCVGMGELGRPVLEVVNPHGHTVEFESSSHLVPEVTKLTYSNTVEELVFALGYAADTSGHNFGLIAPGERKTFTLAGTGRHEIVFDASGAAFLGTATRMAAESLAMVLSGGISENVKRGEKTARMANILLQSVNNASCIASLEEAGAGPGGGGTERSVAQLTAISTALIGCGQEVLKASLGAGGAIALGAVLFALGGVKTLISGVSGFVYSLKKSQFLLLDVAGNDSIAGADSTEIVTVDPFEDGTAEQAEVVSAGKVECDDEEFSLRVDAVQCMVEPDGPGQGMAGMFRPCFRDPSGQPQVACMVPNGSWVLLEHVSTFDPYGFGEAGGDREPEDGRPFHMELVDGGSCTRASGSGSAPPAGYRGWAGHCYINGQTTVMWVPEEPLDEGIPFLAGVSDDGYLQLAHGPAGEQPVLVEVARAYR